MRGDSNKMSRIDGNPTFPGRTAGEDVEVQPRHTTNAGPASATADAIMLPSRHAAIQRAQDVAQRALEMRQERIEQLSQALQAGELVLDSEILADKLIGTQFSDLRPAA